MFMMITLLENLKRSMNYNDINFPVFVVHTDNVELIDGILFIDTQVLDDRNMKGDTLGKRRLQTPMKGLYPLKYMIEDDNITPTPYYMENSTLGMLTPFSIFKYVDINTGRAFDDYQNSLIPVYYSNIKFNDPENDPFYLVYASPSFYSQEQGAMSAIFIYKINHDYTPQN